MDIVNKIRSLIPILVAALLLLASQPAAVNAAGAASFRATFHHSPQWHENDFWVEVSDIHLPEGAFCTVYLEPGHLPLSAFTNNTDYYISGIEDKGQGFTSATVGCEGVGSVSVPIGHSAVLNAAITDGCGIFDKRLNPHCGDPVALYYNAETGWLEVWMVNSDSTGTLVAQGYAAEGLPSLPTGVIFTVKEDGWFQVNVQPWANVTNKEKEWVFAFKLDDPTLTEYIRE